MEYRLGRHFCYMKGYIVFEKLHTNSKSANQQYIGGGKGSIMISFIRKYIGTVNEQEDLNFQNYIQQLLTLLMNTMI